MSPVTIAGLGSHEAVVTTTNTTKTRQHTLGPILDTNAIRFTFSIFCSGVQCRSFSCTINPSMEEEVTVYKKKFLLHRYSGSDIYPDWDRRSCSRIDWTGNLNRATSIVNIDPYMSPSDHVASAKRSNVPHLVCQGNSPITGFHSQIGVCRME